MVDGFLVAIKLPKCQYELAGSLDNLEVCDLYSGRTTIPYSHIVQKIAVPVVLLLFSAELKHES